MKTRYVVFAAVATLFGGVLASGQTSGKLSDSKNTKRAAIAGGRSGISRPRVSSSAEAKTSLAGASKAVTSVTLLSSVATASPAQSFAVNGGLAYVCDNNEITVVNIANPASLQVVGTAVSGLVNNSRLTYCSVQRNTLAVFADQAATTVGNTPGFSAFSLTNPLQPQLIAATPINKRFFQNPVYIGNLAFVPTAALRQATGGMSGQNGDLLAMDVTSFSAPFVYSTLQVAVLDAEGDRHGGATAVFGVTQADNALLYIGGSTSTGDTNNGRGRLQVVDISNPGAMKVVAQRLIPGTVHFKAPLVQGNVAVGIGTTEGFILPVGRDPENGGNIVLSVFEISDRRSPALVSVNTTGYLVGPGGGSTRIGNYLFAFGGVMDTSGNPVLLIVDATNPAAPVIQALPVPQRITSLQAIGTTLYATLGTAGFAAYSIPGIGGGQIFSCPTFVDAMLVLDRGMNISGPAFLDAKAALQTFINSLHFPADKVGVASFTNVANVDRPLTTNVTQAIAAFDGIIAGGTSYIGAGIAAAQSELTGGNHNAAATPMMIIVSDGRDNGAPSSSATLSAANAAKAAGIRVISVQYGSSTGTLMQSIASSSTDFYQVGQ